MTKASFAVSRKLDPALPGRDLSLADLGALDLPRFQAGLPPQHLLLTLLGDYLAGRDVEIPSAALVSLLGDFGIQPAGARAALSRLAARGLLIGSRAGRSTFYRPAPNLTATLPHAQALTLRFGPSPTDWDGQWTFVTFSLPESDRHLRSQLRTQLRVLGFAPLFDGVWVSPYPPPPELDGVLEAIGTTCAAVLHGVADVRRGRIDPITAWDVDESRARFADFVATFRPVRTRLRAGKVGAGEALVTRIRAVYQWFVIATVDPDLPAALLPSDWPRDGAHALFVEVVDTLAPLAEARVRQIFGDYSADLATLVTSAPLAGEAWQAGRQ